MVVKVVLIPYIEGVFFSREIYVVFALKYHKDRMKTKAFEVRKTLDFTIFL